MKNEFTLKDVISDRILDPTVGWRDRLPEEVIQLTDAQKESFLEVFGKGRRQRTKASLQRFINYPRGYALSANRWWAERISWVGDRCQYCAGQDYTYEISQIVNEIRAFA